jgi:NADPH-dependent stearoyl-CoA 9-desaturase
MTALPPKPQLDKAAFARELDALHKKYQAMVGEEDVEWIAGIDRLSKRMTLLGRALLQLSFEPVTWSAGVACLFVGKQLSLTELGHVIMHGTYDKLPGGERFHSETYEVDVPIDPDGWKLSHNVLHHGYPNVVGKDPDARFGLTRQNEHIEWKPHHRLQLFEVAFNWLNMARNLNMQVVGLVDFYFHEDGDEDILEDRSPKSVLRAHARFLKEQLPYAVKNYVLWPALAGPFFPKVLAGNLLAEAMRNVFTATAIYGGHIGEEISDFDPTHKNEGRADWYLQQIAATSNFECSHRVSVLLGALDRQIEHHLFPRLPPNRLRDMAPELKTICEKYGVPYRSEPYLQTLGGMVKRLVTLSRKPTAA